MQSAVVRSVLAAAGGGKGLRLLVAGVLGLALSGCILGSEHPDAALTVPAVYQAAPKAPDLALPAEDWWRGFKSIELSQFVDTAREKNLDIAVAIAQIVQADAQVGIAGGALLPTVTGVASAEALKQPGTLGTTLFNVGPTASYMLDFWGKNRATLYAAAENAVASRYNRDVVALTTIVTVANTYFQVLAAKDSLAVAQDNLAASTRILTLIQDEFASGTVSQFDVSQQAALVAMVRASIPPLEVTLLQNTAALAVLLARVPEGFKIKGTSLNKLAVPRVTPGLPSELLLQRPDIRQAEAQLAGSNFSVEAARAAFLPQIQLTGTTGFQSAALSSLFSPGAWYYTLIAGLTQPIFDGGVLDGQLAQAKGVQLQYLQAYRKAVLSAFADVENALVALQQTTTQERLQNDVVTSSRKAFDIGEEQLKGGTASLISVLQAEQTLFTAETALVQVRLNRMMAATSVFQALGGGWPSPTELVTLHAGLPAP
jgi:NodT family efflux transporter outer membrane factor (OMF) lipoprotein